MFFGFLSEDERLSSETKFSDETHLLTADQRMAPGVVYGVLNRALYFFYMTRLEMVAIDLVESAMFFHEALQAVLNVA